MINIREYFDTLYVNVANDEEWDKVNEYEQSVYNMDDEDFFKWAKENNIDLDARLANEKEAILTYWCWDMAEAEEYEGLNWAPHDLIENKITCIQLNCKKDKKKTTKLNTIMNKM